MTDQGHCNGCGVDDIKLSTRRYCVPCIHEKKRARARLLNVLYAAHGLLADVRERLLLDAPPDAPFDCPFMKSLDKAVLSATDELGKQADARKERHG